MANNNANQPPYVSFYGMSRDPFSPEAEADLYYSEPTRKQRLDVLLHLTEYGNEVMVVFGPRGSGKTALQKQFQKNQHENWKTVPIEVQEGFDERKFLQQLYRQMDLPFRGATFNELLDYMEKHFRQLQENSVLPVILIDNAEQLPVTALKKILELASLTSKDNKPLIRVILFGTEKINEQLRQPQLGHLVNLPMRTMDLPQLSEEQTVHYILHRTLAAKFNGKDIFNEATLLRIYRDSFGWPARINEICRELLLNSVPGKHQEALPGMETQSRNPKQLVAAGITFAVLAAVLVFQSQISDWVNHSSGLLAQITNGTPQQEPGSPVNQTTENAEPTATPEPATLVEKLKSRDTGYRSTNDETEQETLEPENNAPENNAPENNAPEKPAPETPAPQMPTAKAVRPTVTTEPPVNQQLNIERGNEWIVRQNPDHFTLQMVAGATLKTIDDFRNRHQLRDNIALYSGLRKGNPWYGLIYGIYESKPTAMAAVDQLPQSLKGLKPWVRPLGGIQKSLRTAPVATTTQSLSLKERLSKPRPVSSTSTEPRLTENSAKVQPVVEINRKEDWILRQRYNHYTLQLATSDNIDTIHRFINQHRLKNSIALYQTTQDDKPRYVLIYGIYSNEQLAQTGISHLPASLRQVNHSIRQFSSIHREIKQVTP